MYRVHVTLTDSGLSDAGPWISDYRYVERSTRYWRRHYRASAVVRMDCLMRDGNIREVVIE